jgi:hypothetical protein
VIALAKLQFQSAIWTAVHDRDKRPLLNLLRSDFQLSADDKAELADFIEGKLKRPRDAGLGARQTSYTIPSPLM